MSCKRRLPSTSNKERKHSESNNGMDPTRRAESPKLHLGKVPLWNVGGRTCLFKGCPSLVPERGDLHFLGTSMEQFVSEGSHTHPQKKTSRIIHFIQCEGLIFFIPSGPELFYEPIKTRANSASKNATQERAVV